MASNPPSSTRTGKREPEYAVTLAGKKDPTIPYYVADIRDRISPQIRQLLQDYTGIESAQIPEHLQEIRDKAWEVRAYPCIGLAIFCQPPLLPTHSFYPDLKSRLRDDESSTFLDIGSFPGIDLRVLLSDVASNDSPGKRASIAKRLGGVDVVNFWDIGHLMFRDDDASFPVTFFKVDGLDTSIGAPIAEFMGKVDVINIAQVLHQCDFAGQTIACKSLIRLLRRSGSAIIGNQVGWHQAHEIMHGKTTIFGQSVQSWKEMWRKIEDETGTTFDVEVELRTWEQCGINREHTKYLGEDTGLMFFTCKML